MKSWHTLEGKTIWVTGGAGYLGSAITAELDAHCAKVVCFDLPGHAEAFIKARKLARTVPLSLDVNDAAALPGALAAVIAQHGLPDGVVHLAYASSKGYVLEDLPAEEFRKTLDLALTPTFVLCRELAERMKLRGSGSIVLFSSMYGVVAPNKHMYREKMRPNPIDYGASKAAMLQLSRYYAMYYGTSGLRFNCITPGPFPNPAAQQDNPTFMGEIGKKTLLHRFGQNTEIVGPTLFLLTDSASFVTGHNLVVDGGWTAW